MKKTESGGPVQASLRGFRSTLENLKKGNWVICGTGERFLAHAKAPMNAKVRVKTASNGWSMGMLLSRSRFSRARRGSEVKDGVLRDFVVNDWHWPDRVERIQMLTAKAPRTQRKESRPRQTDGQRVWFWPAHFLSSRLLAALVRQAKSR